MESRGRGKQADRTHAIIATPRHRPHRKKTEQPPGCGINWPMAPSIARASRMNSMGGITESGEIGKKVIGTIKVASATQPSAFRLLANRLSAGTSWAQRLSTFQCLGISAKLHVHSGQSPARARDTLATSHRPPASNTDTNATVDRK